MDDELVDELIGRDWEPFVNACERLQIGEPIRDGTRVDVSLTAPGTDERFRTVLLCDGYDAQAPLLDFAEVESGASLGREHWPRLAGAPMNSISYDGRYLPIVCVPGTRGYHLHSSHSNEAHERSIWRLPAVATLIWRMFNQWGPLQGRGV